MKNRRNESWKLAVKKIIGDPIKSYQLTKVGGPSELAIHLTPQRNFQNLFPTKVFLAGGWVVFQDARCTSSPVQAPNDQHHDIRDGDSPRLFRLVTPQVGG